MFSTANTFTLTLPDNTEIVIGPPETDNDDWVGLVGQSGITSSVELRESRSPISMGDGEVIGESFWGSRSVVADVFLPFSDPIVRADKIRKLQTVTKCMRSSGVLRWTEQDSDETEKQLPVRLQSFPTLGHTDSVTKTYQIVFTATQPHIDAGGDVEIFTDGEEDEEYTITNTGDWEAWPQLRIWGPFTGATLTNETTGEAIVINGADVDTNEWVDIFTRPDQLQIFHRTYLDPIGTNIYNTLVLGSNFPRLLPGDNIFVLSGLSGDDGDTHFDMSWRAAYM